MKTTGDSLDNLQLRDWRARAEQCGYRVAIVARQLGVSSRWLEIYFKARFSASPHELFAQWREREIRIQARAGKTGKEIAAAVGISHCSSLSRTLHRADLSLRELKHHAQARSKTLKP